MSEKIKIALPIIVEGRYDKATLAGFVDATVITTEGFGIFNNKEKQALLRRLCRDGAIVLTDSDGGGTQIRSFLSGILPAGKLHHVYIPKMPGKERRKAKASKAGTLGVEGMSRDVLERALAPFIGESASPRNCEEMLTMVDFLRYGLTGADGASEKRDTVARAAGLPDGMSAKALLSALGLLYGRGEAAELIADALK